MKDTIKVRISQAISLKDWNYIAAKSRWGGLHCDGFYFVRNSRRARRIARKYGTP